jgi:hypothetical protein
MPFDRRTFLRAAGVAAGVAGAGGLLAACGGGSPIPGGEPGLSVANASFETLTGPERRLNLVVTENDATPIVGAELAIYLRTLEGEVLDGPFEATYHPEEGEGTGSGRGLYQTLLPLPDPGMFDVVAVEGDRWGAATVTVVTPEQAQAPVPGQPAIATATPTVADPLGVSPICTEDPPCPLHEVSLDDALTEGRPVMLLFATPAYCQTVACAPAVGNLTAVRADGEWNDTAFIHVEIYPDEQAVADLTLTQAVTDWGLPTEPWLFAIRADGVIADRLDGPMLAADMRRLAEQVV